MPLAGPLRAPADRHRRRRQDPRPPPAHGRRPPTRRQDLRTGRTRGQPVDRPRQRAACAVTRRERDDWPSSPRSERGGDRRGDRRVRGRRSTSRRGRLRRRPFARRQRLPDQRVPVAAHEPAHRSVGRDTGAPRRIPHRRRPGGPRRAPARARPVDEAGLRGRRRRGRGAHAFRRSRRCASNRGGRTGRGRGVVQPDGGLRAGVDRPLRRGRRQARPRRPLAAPPAEAAGARGVLPALRPCGPPAAPSEGDSRRGPPPNVDHGGDPRARRCGLRRDGTAPDPRTGTRPQARSGLARARGLRFLQHLPHARGSPFRTLLAGAEAPAARARRLPPARQLPNRPLERREELCMSTTTERSSRTAGVTRTARPTLANYWHPIARSEDVVEQPKQFELLGDKICAFRTVDGVSAFKDLCIHRGTALSLGWVTDGRITCAYHGWEYDSTGRCVKIPSLPEGSTIPRKARAIAYRAEERYGLVWVAMEEPVAPIPAFPHDEWDDPAFRGFLSSTYVWSSSAGRSVENFMDVSHFPFVHENLLGTRDQTVVAETNVVETDHGLYYMYEQEEPNELY